MEEQIYTETEVKELIAKIFLEISKDLDSWVQGHNESCERLALSHYVASRGDNIDKQKEYLLSLAGAYESMVTLKNFKHRLLDKSPVSLWLKPKK